MIDIQGGTNSAITLQGKATITSIGHKKIRFKMQMRHIKTSLLEVMTIMMMFQGDKLIKYCLMEEDQIGPFLYILMYSNRVFVEYIGMLEHI